MRIVVLGAAAALAGFAVADAGEPEVSPWLNASAALGAFAESGAARSAPVARVSAGVEAGWLLDGGWTLGGVVGGAIEADARRSGALGACQPPVCAGAEGRVSPVSRLTDAPDPRGPASRAAFDRAYLFARGPWGEATIGRDAGAARRFSLAPPSVLSASTAFDPVLDPSGIGGVRLSADLVGPSAKATALSPRWLGLRIGASYTPRVEGPDLADPPAGKNARRFAGRDVAEAGISFDRTWRSGLSTTFGLAWSRGEGGARFGTVDALSWGAQIGRGPFRLGLSGLEGEIGAERGRKTRSLALGGTYERGDWAFEASSGRMRDQAFGAVVHATTLAARKTLSDQVSVAIAASVAERRLDHIYSVNGARSSGVRIEFSAEL